MGIHPIDAVMQHRQKFGADGAPVLDEIAVGDGDAVDDVALGYDGIAVEDDANLTLAQSIHRRRRYRHADIDLPGHGHGEDRIKRAARDGLELDMLFGAEIAQQYLGHRTWTRIGDAFALQVVDRLDRTIGR